MAVLLQRAVSSAAAFANTMAFASSKRAKSARCWDWPYSMSVRA